MFGKLGEIMRRKINQKGALLSTIFIVGAASVLVGKVILDATNSSVYGILRSLCIFIDTQVYSISAFAYSIFYEISSSSILSSLNLSDASQRLYTLLGIFMLFRLAFSFVKYIINPDGMEKGTSKLLTNLAVSLALIVSVPWIFNRAFALQNYIMDSNVIGNLIMGMNTSKDSDTFNAASYGQTIGFLTFSAFYRVDSSIPAYSSCGNLLSYYSPSVIPMGDKEVGIDKNYNFGNDQENKESEKIVACVNALNGIGNDTIISYSNGGQPAELGTLLYIASQRQDMGILTDSSLLQAVVGNTYLIQYSLIVSTIAGGFLALLFLSFSFDVAVRNAKLCFLQLIAPIPIILNIEPGDSKSDKKSLNWWTKECLHTYALLFIRVATVYFGVFLINVLFGSLSSTTYTNTSAWFQVFMILGILLFVKEIPDMIGKAFGIDVKGQFNLNPLKRIGDSKLASMAVGGAAGLIGGGIGTGIAAGIAARRNGASVGEAISRGLTGGVGGALHSAVSGAKTGAKSIHDITSNATKNWQRSGRIGGANVGTTLGGRLGSRVSMTMGAKTAYQREEDNAVALEMPGKKLSEIKSIMNGDKTKVSTGVTIGAGTRSFNSLEEIDDFLSNNSQLTDADRSNVMKARTSLAGGKNPTVSVSLAGRSFDNVKDVYDHLERLKASGASENAIKEAEDQLNIIQGQRWNDAISSANASKKPNVYSLNRDELVEIYEQNQELYQTHVTDASGKPITNFDVWGNLKTAAGSGKLGSGAVRQGARQAKLNDDAAKARRGGG